LENVNEKEETTSTVQYINITLLKRKKLQKNKIVEV